MMHFFCLSGDHPQDGDLSQSLNQSWRSIAIAHCLHQHAGFNGVPQHAVVMAQRNICSTVAGFFWAIMYQARSRGRKSGGVERNANRGDRRTAFQA